MPPRVRASFNRAPTFPAWEDATSESDTDAFQYIAWVRQRLRENHQLSDSDSVSESFTDSSLSDAGATVGSYPFAFRRGRLVASWLAMAHRLAWLTLSNPDFVTNVARAFVYDQWKMWMITGTKAYRCLSERRCCQKTELIMLSSALYYAHPYGPRGFVVWFWDKQTSRAPRCMHELYFEPFQEPRPYEATQHFMPLIVLTSSGHIIAVKWLVNECVSQTAMATASAGEAAVSVLPVDAVPAMARGVEAKDTPSAAGPANLPVISYVVGQTFEPS